MLTRDTDRHTTGIARMMLPVVRRAYAGRATAVVGALTVAFVLGCADSPTAPIWPPVSARLVGTLGSEAFVAHFQAFIKLTPEAPDSLTLYASRWNFTRGVSEYLSISVAFTGPGEYALGPTQVELLQRAHFPELVESGAVSNSSAGYARTVGRFSGSQPAPGRLTISAIGAVGEPVKGTVRFWLSPSMTGMPDTASVEFTGGQFTTALGAPVSFP